MSPHTVIDGSYLAASLAFILTLQFLSSPRLARKGVLIGALGMAAAIVGTLLHPEITTYKWALRPALRHRRYQRRFRPDGRGPRGGRQRRRQPRGQTNKSSPIYGMPVFNAELARTVIVLKRSMNTGFSGLDNELFCRSNTMVVLGDSKKTLQTFKSGIEAAA